MKILLLCLIIPWIGLYSPLPVAGQPLVDSLFQWRGYIHPGRCRLRIFERGEDENRPYTIVMQELAENRGPLIHEDLAYLAEEISRAFDLDAASAYWIIHWGDFTFPDASSPKELFLRATFRRGSNGRLGAPQWRVLRREEVEVLTDRWFR